MIYNYIYTVINDLAYADPRAYRPRPRKAHQPSVIEFFKEERT